MEAEVEEEEEVEEEQKRGGGRSADAAWHDHVKAFTNSLPMSGRNTSKSWFSRSLTLLLAIPNLNRGQIRRTKWVNDINGPLKVHLKIAVM